MSATNDSIPKNIYISSYERDDGKVTAIKTRDGWILRCIWGASWFWNFSDKKWVISTTPGLDIHTKDYLLNHSQAINILSIIEPVK